MDASPMTPHADAVPVPADAPDGLGTRRFAGAAWAVLACTIAVIVWGAVVRATGSGAGCGAHWPLCNGAVVPLEPRLATIIEFTHRLTSGLLLAGSLGLAVAARRLYPVGHPARRAAAMAFVLVIVEALIGAGIVLLRLVENDASALRAVYIAGHLVNTMFLVAAITATVWAARPRGEIRAALSPMVHACLRVGLVALLVVSAAGAVVALGDTLFPQSGFSADFDPASHFLLRLRVWHPILAVATGLFLVWLVARTAVLDDDATRRAARWTIALVTGQLALGAANVLTAAPLALQMAHLAASNALWVAVVWMWLPVRAAARRTRPAPAAESASSRTPR